MGEGTQRIHTLSRHLHVFICLEGLRTLPQGFSYFITYALLPVDWVSKLSQSCP